jgi:hypothetical protein
MCTLPINFWLLVPILMRLGTMATQPISTTYFVNLSHQSVFLCASLPLLGCGSIKTFTRQRINATVEEMLDASFSVVSVPCRTDSVCLSAYAPIVVRQRLGKHVPTTTKNFLRCRFLCGPCRIKLDKANNPFKYGK